MNPFPDARSVLVLDNCQIHHNDPIVDLVRAASEIYTSQIHHLIADICQAVLSFTYPHIPRISIQLRSLSVPVSKCSLVRSPQAYDILSQSRPTLGGMAQPSATTQTQNLP